MKAEEFAANFFLTEAIMVDEPDEIKWLPGELVYDPRLRRVGMIARIEERTKFSHRTQQPFVELLYNVLLFGDDWCREQKTRDYQIIHGNYILETYSPDEHN